MRKINIGMAAWVVAAVTLFAACGARAQEAQQQPGQPPQQPGALSYAGGADFDPNQPIKPGFQLSINVSSAAGNEPDLSGVFVVDPVGNVQMKLAGAINVKGLTPSQAADKIAAALKPYIKNPTVQVNILSVPKPVVFFTGAVGRVGPTQINDKMSLAEALTTLGFTENADLSHVRVTSRDETGKRTTREYDFTRWLKPLPGQKPDESQNPELTDRDTVFVPLKQLPGTGNVSVEGDVPRPGVVSIRVGVPTTIREALSLSGGPNPTADRRMVTVRRVGVERPLVVDLDRAEQGDPANNIELRADDVVYVQRLPVEYFVNLNGAFIRPGRLPYTQQMTLTQAVGDAGGLQPIAKEWDGRIFRHVNGPDPTRTQVIPFNYKKVRDGKQPDMTLEPGDTVEIPLGNPPRPPLDPLSLATSLLSIALLVDRLLNPNRLNGF